MVLTALSLSHTRGSLQFAKLVTETCRVSDVAQIQFNLREVPFLTEAATTFISDAFVGPSQANTSSAFKHYL